ncbi:MAG: sel1 repeat family protein [Bacteroidales bacterium]|nr:sel1 repeat family protein [Bacteroidales bacterium]
MKKVILAIVALLVLQLVSAQEKVIDMASFKDYLSEYNQAQKKKDKAKIKELEAGKGKVYDRKALAKRARESRFHDYYNDREACAFLAAYYENDYYQKQRKIDLSQAVRYYERATKRAFTKKEDKELSQVFLCYARCLIVMYNHHKLDDVVKAGGLEAYYYSRQSGHNILYTQEELNKNLLRKIGELIIKSAGNGGNEGAYWAARMYRNVGMPYGIRYINSPRAYELLECVHASYVNQFKQGYAVDCWNEIVVGYYTIAAANGKPQYQMEFAEYLLHTIYEGWQNTLTTTKCPFVYRKNPSQVFNGLKFVIDYLPTGEIEEQLTYWYLQAAKQDYAPAMVNLAFCMFYQLHPYDDSLHYSDIIYWLEKASTLGDTTAMYNLSVVKLVSKRRTNTHQDTLDAFYWAKRGADSGDSKCMHLLGRYYYYGIGARIDKKEALRWFKAAADKGADGAAYMAGNLYADKSVGNDMSVAVKYYESAKEVAEAYMKLSTIYANGDGVTMDKQKARKYEKMVGWYKYYEDFRPGLCFYSCDYYSGEDTKHFLKKQSQL